MEWNAMQWHTTAVGMENPHTFGVRRVVSKNSSTTNIYALSFYEEFGGHLLWMVLDCSLFRSCSQDVGLSCSHLKAGLVPEESLPKWLTMWLPRWCWAVGRRPWVTTWASLWDSLRHDSSVPHSKSLRKQDESCFTA